MDERISEFLSICKKRYLECNASLEEKKQLEQYPHLFLLGCFMDRQIDFRKAFNIPFRIAELLGSKDFDVFAKQDLDYYISIFEKNNLHRFNKIMAEVFYEAIIKIKTEYNGKTENLWNDNPSSAMLIFRLIQFKGIGPKIATMVANILSRDYKIPLSDKASLDISPDVHVKRIFYKMGFTNSNSVEQTIYAARYINPSFPGMPDILCWEIGNKRMCTDDRCNSLDCPLNNVCLKINTKVGV